MAAGDLVTADWQIEYGGLLLGDGTVFDIVRVEGLLDLPEVQTTDRQRLRRHGLVPGDDFLGGRKVTVTLEVYGESPEQFATDLQALGAAVRPGGDELPLVFRIPGVAGGGRRWVSCKPRRRSLPVDLDFLYRMPVAVVEFHASDPRLYDASVTSGTSSLLTTDGGMAFPASFPLAFAATVGGTVVATNEGTFPTPPQFRIDGPVVNPRVENATTGEVLAIDLELAAGEWLDIDTEARSVLLGGTASRYSSLAAGSSWWELPPGQTPVTFRASTSSTALLTVTWRSAWV